MNTNGKIAEGIMVGKQQWFKQKHANKAGDIGRNIFKTPSWVALLYHLRS